MIDALMRTIKELGAANAGLVRVKDIAFEPSFRTLCEQNACGMFGKCWMCPPSVGEVDQLIARAKAYQHAIVFQMINALEDSYDFEGMMEAGERMNALIQELRQRMDEMRISDYLLLGAGSCRVCERCAKADDKPCRFPNAALASLEAYGINVSTLAPLAGMKYINGANTVTYFGAVFIEKEA